MFEALTVATELIKSLGPLLPPIKRRDPDLAAQLRRAATSVASCIAEGAQRDGADRLHLYRVASGSAKEVMVQLDIAVAWGYITPTSITDARKLADRVGAITWRLTHPRSK